MILTNIWMDQEYFQLKIIENPTNTDFAKAVFLTQEAYVWAMVSVGSAV